jgi:3-isopropylmalate/(R)-2-methylmalate dehydratase small subunit
VWAIQQAGFRAVVSRRGYDTPGYSDIFRQNAANCGLLLIELPDDEHAQLVEAGTGAPIEIDLPAQTIALPRRSFRFEINEVNKLALVEGLDLIGTTLVYDGAISAYEQTHDSFLAR